MRLILNHRAPARPSVAGETVRRLAQEGELDADVRSLLSLSGDHMFSAERVLAPLPEIGREHLARECAEVQLLPELLESLLAAARAAILGAPANQEVNFSMLTADVGFQQPVEGFAPRFEETMVRRWYCVSMLSRLAGLDVDGRVMPRVDELRVASPVRGGRESHAGFATRLTLLLPLLLPEVMSVLLVDERISASSRPCKTELRLHVPIGDDAEARAAAFEERARGLLVQRIEILLRALERIRMV